MCSSKKQCLNIILSLLLHSWINFFFNNAQNVFFSPLFLFLIQSSLNIIMNEWMNNNGDIVQRTKKKQPMYNENTFNDILLCMLNGEKKYKTDMHRWCQQNSIWYLMSKVCMWAPIIRVMRESARYILITWTMHRLALIDVRWAVTHRNLSCLMKRQTWPWQVSFKMHPIKINLATLFLPNERKKKCRKIIKLSTNLFNISVFILHRHSLCRKKQHSNDIVLFVIMRWELSHSVVVIIDIIIIVVIKRFFTSTFISLSLSLTVSAFNWVLSLSMQATHNIQYTLEKNYIKPIVEALKWTRERENVN